MSSEKYSVKELYVVYAPVEHIGDNGVETDIWPVAIFDDYDLARDEMDRWINATDCNYCIDSFYLNHVGKI